MKKFLIILFCICLGMLSVSCQGKANVDIDGSSPGDSSINGEIEEDDDNNKFVDIREPLNYPHIDTYLVNNNKSDYMIVIQDDAGSEILDSVKELNNFLSLATGVSLQVKESSQIQWTKDTKCISLGINDISQKAGFVIPKGLNTSGFAVKTIDKSVFIGGTTERATRFGVYEFLRRIIGFEVYADNEIYYVPSKLLFVPNFDFSLQPDIEYRPTMNGYLGKNETLASRMGYNGMIWMYPEGSGPYHNSLDYIDYDTYSKKHPDWFSSGGDNLCYTAHGNKEEYNAMVDLVVEEMKHIIDTNPKGNAIALTHQDNDKMCTCSACSEDKNKYHTGAGSIIKFMNDVITSVEEWKNASIHKDRDIFYVMFAYTFTINAPTKIENGKIVPIDDSVKPHEKLGVIYAPILSDFVHDKYHINNADVFQIQKNWSAILDDRLCLWYYSTYFYDYFVTYNNFDSMQGNLKAAKETGCIWMFNQSQYDNKNSSCFIRLKSYLEGKLMWDVNANIEELTDNYFKYYFKQAYPYMRKYYDAMRLHYAYLTEYKDVGGWIGNVLTSGNYFSVNTLEEWLGYIDEAYKAILPIKNSDTELYNVLYDRICLESLSPRYMLIKLYDEEIYTEKDSTQKKLQFKLDCGRLNITHLSEHRLISVLWGEWEI